MQNAPYFTWKILLEIFLGNKKSLLKMFRMLFYVCHYFLRNIFSLIMFDFCFVPWFQKVFLFLQVIVARDPEALNYINSIKVVPAHWYYNPDEEVWALSNKFVHFNLGMLSATDYNFRILSAPVKNLVAGTKCKIPEKTVFHLEEIDSEDGHLAVENE